MRREAFAFLRVVACIGLVACGVGCSSLMRLALYESGNETQARAVAVSDEAPLAYPAAPASAGYGGFPGGAPLRRGATVLSSAEFAAPTEPPAEAAAPEAPPPPPSVSVPGGGEATPPPLPVAPPGAKRLVIYTASLSVLVAKVEDSMQQILVLVEEWEGFIQSSDLKRVTFRVPAQTFERAIETITAMGVVTDKQIHAEDVTSQFRDLELRLEVAEQSRRRLMEILKQSGKMEDILEVEKEIRRLTQEIEQMRAELRTMADRIAYSTITVEFTAKVPEPRLVIDRPSRQASYFDWINQVGAQYLINQFPRR